MAFSPRAGLTLEEVRQRNIARNNDFLKNLFGPSEEETASVVAPVAPNTEDAESVPVESIRARDKQMLALKEEVKKIFQNREAETEQIFGYLSDELQSAPTLQLYGPSGSGKTALCSRLLEAQTLPHSFIQCAGFTNSRQFYTALWAQIASDLKDCRSGLNAKYNVNIHLGTKETKTPHKFSYLSLYLGKLIYNLFESTPLPSHAENNCYYIVLDGAEQLNVLEAKLAINMLQLSRHSHMRIKVISISHHLIQSPHPTLIVQFPAYSEKQLASIVFRLFLAQMDTFKSTFSADELLESIIQCYVPSFSINNVTNASCDDLETLEQSLLAPLLDSVAQTVRNTFYSVLQTALASLMYTTTHPVVLLRAAESTYTALYGCTPEITIRSSVNTYLEHTLCLAEQAQQVQQYMSPTATARNITTPHRTNTNDSTTSRDTNNNAHTPSNKANKRKAVSLLPTITILKEQLNPVLAHYLPGATAGQVRAAVRLVNHLPVFSFHSDEIVQYARRGKVPVELVKPSIVYTDGISNGDSSSAGSKGAATKVSTLEKVDSESMRMQRWALSCPVRLRYLVLAAFLAGNNPKESDNMKFVGAQEGRRKKQRMGTDHDVDLAVAAGAKKTGGAAALMTSRYFSLERLISIYAQLVGIITGRPAANYGDVALYSSLRSLVEKGLLSQAPHWDLQRPFYLSCITQDTAVELAKTVNNFNLGDFMYYNNQHNPL